VLVGTLSTTTVPCNIGAVFRTTLPVPVFVVTPVPPYATAKVPEVIFDALENPVVTIPVRSDPLPRMYAPDTFPDAVTLPTEMVKGNCVFTTDP
jgi:hypothetical protein